MSEKQYPKWVEHVLENIAVTIYRDKASQILKEKTCVLNLKNKVLSSGKSRRGEQVFVIGFEDEEDIWKECADIIVKIYKLKREEKTFYRVEVFCSGVNRKEIFFKDEKILDYEGYSEDDIMRRKTVKSTIIFDVTSP